MIKGIVTCLCGQVFGFETASETVRCPKCKASYVAAEEEEDATPI